MNMGGCTIIPGSRVMYSNCSYCILPMELIKNIHKKKNIHEKLFRQFGLVLIYVCLYCVMP